MGFAEAPSAPSGHLPQSALAKQGRLSRAAAFSGRSIPSRGRLACCPKAFPLQACLQRGEGGPPKVVDEVFRSACVPRKVLRSEVLRLPMGFAETPSAPSGHLPHSALTKQGRLSRTVAFSWRSVPYARGLISDKQPSRIIASPMRSRSHSGSPPCATGGGERSEPGGIVSIPCFRFIAGRLRGTTRPTGGFTVQQTSRPGRAACCRCALRYRSWRQGVRDCCGTRWRSCR